MQLYEIRSPILGYVKTCISAQNRHDFTRSNRGIKTATKCIHHSFTTVQRRRTHARGMTSPYIIRQLGQGQGLLVKTSFTVRQRIYDCLFTFFRNRNGNCTSWFFAFQCWYRHCWLGAWNFSYREASLIQVDHGKTSPLNKG